MSQTTRRALRTLCQAAPAGVITGLLVAFNLITAVQAAALAPVLTVLFTVGYNLLEDLGVPTPVGRGNHA